MCIGIQCIIIFLLFLFRGKFLLPPPPSSNEIGTYVCAQTRCWLTAIDLTSQLKGRGRREREEREEKEERERKEICHQSLAVDATRERHYPDPKLHDRRAAIASSDIDSNVCRLNKQYKSDAATAAAHVLIVNATADVTVDLSLV